MKKLFSVITIFALILLLESKLWAKEIIAEVGPYKLYKEDVNELIENDPQIQQILKIKPELKREIVKVLINRWVKISLLALAGEREGLNNDPEVKRKLIEAKKDILAERYLEEKLKTLKVKEEEIRAYYERNKEKYKEPAKVQIKHILIYVPKDADKTTIEKAYKKAEKIRERILKGEKFEELAKIYSDDINSREKGGDLGIVIKGQSIPEFEKEVFKLKEGDISPPIRSRYGYHIVKVEKKFPETIPPFERVKNLVKEDCLKQKEKELITQILKKLEKEYPPKVYLDLNKKGEQIENR